MNYSILVDNIIGNNNNSIFTILRQFYRYNSTIKKFTMFSLIKIIFAYLTQIILIILKQQLPSSFNITELSLKIQLPLNYQRRNRKQQSLDSPVYISYQMLLHIIMALIVKFIQQINYSTQNKSKYLTQ
ncbi:hypothetical protein pb186bvf_017986 [Paramecium bursaria]